MSSLPYLHFVSETSKLGALITVITNALLIYLTYFHIKKITDVYKATILLAASLGIVFSAMELIIHPFAHSFYHSFVYFSTDNMFGAPKPLKTALLMGYSCLYAIFICLIAIQFFYRFCLITNSKCIKLFETRNLPWLLGYGLFFQLIWILAFLEGVPDRFSEDYSRIELQNEYNCTVDDVPGILIVVYENQTIRQSAISCMGGLSFVLITQYAIIIFCGFGIKRKMEELKMSDKTLQVQRQLFRTLILQILTPSVFHHIPVLFMFITAFLESHIRIPYGIMFSFFSFFPAIDSVILMSQVMEYRRVIKRMALIITTSLSMCHSTMDRSEGRHTTTGDLGINSVLPI